MEIGTAILSLDRTQEERRRILNMILVKQGACWQLFEKYAERIDDLDLWNKTQTYLKVKGFRPGNEKAKQLVIKAIHDGLQRKDTKTEQAAEQAFWRLYKRSVAYYFDSEHYSLNQLMGNNNIIGNPEDSKDIFSSIMKYVDLYDVKKESLEVLYEVCWFQRIDNFQEIISNRQLSFEVVTKMMNRLKSQLESQIKKDENLLKDINANIHNIENSQLAKNHETNLDIEAMKQKIDHLAVSFQNQLSNIVSNEIGQIKNKIEKNILEKNQEIDPHVIRSLDQNIASKLKELELELKSKISDIESKLNGQTSISSVVKDKKTISFDEIRFGELFKKINPYFSASASFDKAMKAILLSNQVIIVKSYQLAQVIFESHFKQNMVEVLCATPSWLEVESLKSSIKNIGDESEKILLIQSFDLGYIESYLIPFLYLIKESDLHLKVVLIPYSEEMSSKILSKILNHALVIDENFFEVLNKELRDGCFELEDFLNTSINELVFQDKDSTDLRVLIKNAGANLEDGVFQVFCRHTLLFKNISVHPKHLSLSYTLVLEKYIQSRYGNSKKDQVFGSIRGFLEA